MVRATTNEASSGAQALTGRFAGKAGRARGGQRQTGLFAAILEKTLGRSAAPEKAGRAKDTAQAVRLKALRPARAEKTANRQARQGRAGEYLSPPREKPEISAGLKAEKRVEELATAAQLAAPDTPVRSDFSLERKDPVQAVRENPGGGETETGLPREVPASGPGMYAEAVPAAAEGAKPDSSKTGPPAAAKKNAVKQDSVRAGRKENQEEAAKTSEKTEGAAPAAELKPASAEELKEDNSRQEVEIRVTVRAGDERFADTLRTTDERSIKESASGLLRRMREEANAQIVKSARFILTDKNEGEIRLVLKPESLGEVRIRLSMQDNLIGGRIFVENESVREVFEQNMPNLSSAFRESGFEMGSMNVSVGNGGGRKNEADGFSSFGKPARAEKENLPSVAAEAYYYTFHAVNLMA
ncbi:MAG: flagellar hook-length control protein FliK [Spirochaetales bacterium]|nr:flagellar hook-length control protein FliK [Spirochaetales bacterium]